MDDAQRNAMAIDEWRLLVDSGEAELQCGALGTADKPEAVRAREAIATVRQVLQALAREAQAHDPGDQSANPEPSTPQASAPTRTNSLDLAMHGLARQGEGGRERRGGAPPGVAPALARTSKRFRDAVLRLGVWVVLGQWAAAGVAKLHRRRQLQDLIAQISRSDEPVPPGIAPTPAFAETPEAAAFFNHYLRTVIDRLAELYDGAGAQFGSCREQPPMNRTVAMAGVWSRHWSNATTAVFVDWLNSRGDGALDAARRSLWQYSKKGIPVQFRSPRGLAALPTENRRIHIDLWTQLVLAQVIQYDATRWHTEAVGGRWHPVRLTLHDLHGRTTETPDGSCTVPSGLAVGMVFQSLFIDRVAALVAGASFKEAAMLPSTDPSSSPPIDVPLPGCCPGHQLTMRVIWEWQGGDALDSGAARKFRLAGVPQHKAMDPKQEQAYLRWRAEQMRHARHSMAASRVERLEPDGLDWRPAALLADAEPDEFDIALGHIDLGGVLRDADLWLDVAAVVVVSGRWLELPLEFVDEVIEGSMRTWIMLDHDALEDLKASDIDARELQRRLARSDTSLWVYRRSGAGLFLSIGVDLTAPLPAG